MKTKVLYIEDEEVLAMLVRDHLVRQGYEVSWSGHGHEAFMMYKKMQPDICILDIMLPGTSGYEIGKLIRQADKHVPIIFLTAKSESKDVVEGFKSGGNDYLRKPFSLEELAVRMGNLLSMAGRTSPGVYKIGEMSFDPVRMILENGRETVNLSHRENELMRMLVVRVGSPVERKKILIELWGDDHFFNSRNLDVYVTRLRKYLKMDPEVQLLTLKGVGYQLVEG
jgi:DNA-binding response OmpR family regulator